MEDSFLDAAGRRLALQLHLDDVLHINRQQAKGKRPEASSADADMAPDIFLQSIFGSLGDFGPDEDQPWHGTQRRAGGRVPGEDLFYSAVWNGDKREQSNERLMEALPRDGPSSSRLDAGPFHFEDEDLDPGIYGRPEVLFPQAHDANVRGEKSAQGARGLLPVVRAPETQTRQCLACADDCPVQDLARCPCAHEYCRPCMIRMFELAMANEFLFPPRCCQQPIPVDDQAATLGPGLVNRFHAKAEEFSTRDRIYCHYAHCAAFVRPRLVGDGFALCIRCLRRTCVACKGPGHGEGVCPQDEATRAVLRLGDELGWRRCFNCRNMVERVTGCNHISCLCGAEFCYVCGAPWRTCSCDTFHDPDVQPVPIPGYLLDRQEARPVFYDYDLHLPD